MFPLLAGSVILCFAGILAKVWAKKLPPKMRNESVVASFTRQSCPWYYVCFLKNQRLECENQGTFRIQFFIAIISINYTRSYDIQSFSLHICRCDFWKIYIKKSKIVGYWLCGYFRIMLWKKMNRQLHSFLLMFFHVGGFIWCNACLPLCMIFLFYVIRLSVGFFLKS